jgi:hypothetical protein
MWKRMTSEDSPNATSSPEREHGALQLDMLDGLTPTGSGQHPVHASRSRRLGNEKV